jgi:hypothetical protein
VSQVTVLVPNYNGGAYLRESLESIRAQTLEDWEVVVGDNASTDASLSIIASMADQRIRTVRRPRTIGWVANVNLLLAEASAPYVAILHADDWWEPTFLDTTVGMLQAAPRSLVATSACRIVRAGRAAERVGLFEAWPVSRGSTCPAGEVARLLTDRNLIPSVTVLTRAELYKRFPRYEPALSLLGDWLMWLRAGASVDFEVTDKVLANYRVHAANQSASAEASNLWAMDVLRVGRILAAEWAGIAAPYPGAARAIAAAVASDLLERAALRMERGDHATARRLARLAWATAPGAGQRTLARIGELGIGLFGHGPLARLRPPLTAMARRVKPAVQRSLM